MDATSEQSDYRGLEMSGAFSRALGVIGLLATVLILVPFTPRMPAVGLDPSWQYALNIAIEKKLIFGKDVIFTFGPLGSLYTQRYSPATDSIMMWGSAAYAFAFIAAFGLAVYPRRMFMAIALPLLVIESTARRDPLFISMPLLLLFDIVRTCVSEQSKLYLRATPLVIATLALATVGVGMAPIIKGSFGGIDVPMVTLSTVILARRNAGAAFAFVFLFVATLAGWWVICGQAVRDLPGFFIAQSSIISGYTQAMSLYAPASGPILYIIASLSLCLIAWQVLRSETGIYACPLLAGLAWTLFVAFKAGFVRHDGHVFICVGVLLLVAFAVASFTSALKGVAAFVVSIVAATVMLYTVVPVGWAYPAARIGDAISSVNSGIRSRLRNDNELQRTYRRAVASIRRLEPLPAVSGAVDIYPVELGAIFANGLSWSGRPIFQSYSAYTSNLLKLNADHLRSNAAPTDIFFAFAPIDDRLPALDDSNSILALLSGYRVVGYDAAYVHLERVARLNGTHLLENAMQTTAVSFGQAVEIAGDMPMWVEIDTRPSILGRLADALFKLPPVDIELTLADGTVVRHRYIPQIGDSGFIISPYLASGMDLIDLAAGIPGAQTVKSFRLVTESPNFWKANFTVKQTPIEVAVQETARSLVLTRPTAVVPSFSASSVVPTTQCSIDLVNGAAHHGSIVRAESASVLDITGWIAPPAGISAADFDVWIVATSHSGEKHYFESRHVVRQDVANFFNRADMANSGFSIKLDTGMLRGPQTLEIVTASKVDSFKCPTTLVLD